MDKKSLSERNICTKYITPAIVKAGWDTHTQFLTTFKQIIGRGTRINEEYDKHYFTIIDFRNATDLFADKDFDGDPIRIKPVSEDDDLSTIIDDEPII